MLNGINMDKSIVITFFIKNVLKDVEIKKKFSTMMVKNGVSKFAIQALQLVFFTF